MNSLVAKNRIMQFVLKRFLKKNISGPLLDFFENATKDEEKLSKPNIELDLV